MMTKIIATHRIPYDIDVLWDGGCGGRYLVPDSFGDEVRLLTVFEGLNFKVGERTLVFEEGAVILKEPHSACWGADYWIDGDGIARAKRWEEKEDGEGYYHWIKITTMATAEEFRSVVEFLRKEIAFVGGIQKQAVRMAIGVFERAARMLDEIETFEGACGGGS